MPAKEAKKDAAVKPKSAPAKPRAASSKKGAKVPAKPAAKAVSKGVKKPAPAAKKGAPAKPKAATSKKGAKKAAPAKAAPTKGVKKGSSAKKGSKGPVKPSWRLTLPLYEKKVKNFSIGNDILPKDRNLTHFVKWPRYIRIQRQKRILQQRLKIPPAINQFSRNLPRGQALQLFKLLHKYRPEGKLRKRKRLQGLAKDKAAGKDIGKIKRPIHVITGINAVTQAVETGRAKLVVIAADVDPVELVLWLPALCRKKDIPYCVVRGKARLGKLIRKKTCSTVALPEPAKSHKTEVGNIITFVKQRYNDNVDHRRQWGGGILGPKSRAKILKAKQLIAKEEKLRAKAAAR